MFTYIKSPCKILEANSNQTALDIRVCFYLVQSNFDINQICCYIYTISYYIILNFLKLNLFKTYLTSRFDQFYGKIKKVAVAIYNRLGIDMPLSYLFMLIVLLIKQQNHTY